VRARRGEVRARGGGASGGWHGVAHGHVLRVCVAEGGRGRAHARRGQDRRAAERRSGARQGGKEGEREGRRGEKKEKKGKGKRKKGRKKGEGKGKEEEKENRRKIEKRNGERKREGEGKRERGLVPALFAAVTTAGRPRMGNGQATHLVRGKEDGIAVEFGVGRQDGGEKTERVRARV
jgi:hypothetical protein